MEAALRAGVERVVYTSSVATLALKPRRHAGRRNVPLDEANAIGAYKSSKVAAERLVERMIAQEKLPAVIVNPSTPIGPRDVRPTPTGRIIVEAATGRIPAFVDTGLNFVHVDDVAAGHLAALRQGPDRRALHPRRRERAAADMLADITSLVGRKPPRWNSAPHDHAGRLLRPRPRANSPAASRS